MRLQSGGGGVDSLPRLIFYASALIGGILLPWLRIPMAMSRNAIAIAVASILCAASSIPSFVVSPILLECIARLGSGLGLCLLFYFWICRMTVSDKRQKLVLICGSYLVGAIFLCLLPFIDAFAGFIIAVLPIVSGFSLWRTWAIHPQPCGDMKSSKAGGGVTALVPLKEALPIAKERRLVGRKGLFVCLYCIAFGFLIYTSLACYTGLQSDICLGASCLLGSLPTLYLLRYAKKKAYSTMPEMATCAIPVGLLVLCLLQGTALVFIPIVFLIALFQGLRMLDNYCACEYSDSSCRSQYLWEFWVFFIGKYCGLLAGWMAGTLISWAGLAGFVGFTEAVFCLTVVLGLVHSVVYKRMKTGFSEILENDERTVRVKVPLTDELVELRPVWRDACDALAAKYGLSPRQTEVFMLLAKGRNISFIKDELVISTPTVKTHIHNIYQKVGVHSQQELLDYIEKMANNS